MIQVVAGFLLSISWLSFHVQERSMSFPVGLIAFFFCYFFFNRSGWRIQTTTWIAIIVALFVSFPKSKRELATKTVDFKEIARVYVQHYVSSNGVLLNTVIRTCANRLGEPASKEVGLKVEFDGQGNAIALEIESSAQEPKLEACLKEQISLSTFASQIYLKNRWVNIPLEVVK